MIEINGVSKKYSLGGGAFVSALADVTLRVNEGETISIVGSNGSGKTSLLKCIAGMILPDSGEVRLLGRPFAEMDLAERGGVIAFVHQNPVEGTAAYLSVAENLALGALRGRVPGLRRLLRGGSVAEAGRLLEKVGSEIEARPRQLARTLSGGQRQALAMITAIVGHPRVLLLDEHTASLDPNARKSILSLTTNLVRDYGLTALCVTHNLPDAIEFGDRLLVMHKGCIVLDVSGKRKEDLTADGLIGLLREKEDIALALDAGIFLSTPGQPQSREL